MSGATYTIYAQRLLYPSCPNSGKYKQLSCLEAAQKLRTFMPKGNPEYCIKYFSVDQRLPKI